MAKTEMTPSTSDPQTGGVTSKDTGADSAADLFATKGSEPVRDRKPDPSKGTPVTRYFKKDGTPLEPSNLSGPTPSNLAGPDPDKIPDDVVEVVEYLDEAGSTVTHDSLKGEQDEVARNKAQADKSSKS